MLTTLDEELESPKWIFKVAAGLFVAFLGVSAAVWHLAADLNPHAAWQPMSLDRPLVVVFETASCRWCVRFREKVVPEYERSRLDGLAPMRFVDIAEQAKSGFKLNGRVWSTPTIVVVDRTGAEVARSVGYPDGVPRFLSDMERFLRRVPGSGA
jgi:thioredoxin-related protein